MGSKTMKLKDARRGEVLKYINPAGKSTRRLFVQTRGIQHVALLPQLWSNWVQWINNNYLITWKSPLLKEK